jgi:thiamine-monophosphate kinase
LCLPDALPAEEFDALIDGFVRLAAMAGAPLIGGNLSRSPGPLVVDVTAIGWVRPRRLLRRAGARAGDELYVTGLLGAAATGLAMLTAGGPRPADPDLAACLMRYERPDARYRCGRIVARVGAASAAVDISDGLSDGASRLAEASGIGVVVDASAVPVHPGAAAWAARAGTDALPLAISGGEDYELAFAVGRRQLSRFKAAIRRCPDVSVTRVGRFVPEPGAWLDRDGVREPLGKGFLHF